MRFTPLTLIAIALSLIGAPCIALAASNGKIVLSETTPKNTRATTLMDTVNATLENNKNLKIIQENKATAEHELRSAKSGWGPRIDATGRGGASNLSDSSSRANDKASGMYGAGSVGVTLTQPIWDGFATRSRVRSSEALLESVSSRVLDNATTLCLDGIIAHVNVIVQRENLRLAMENVRRHREILASTAERERGGADTMADVNQTQGRLARALSILSQSQAACNQAESMYLRVTGLPLVPLSLQAITRPSPLYTSPDAIITVAQQKNPKLSAFLADVRTALGQKELAESAYSPVVNLETGPSYSDRGGRTGQWTKGFDVMGTVRWNLFNSGGDVAANKAAAARVRQARQVALNFMDDLTLQVQNTWTQYVSALEQFTYYEEAIIYNTATRDAYNDQFLMGQRSLLDVLDAEGELFNSSTQSMTARGNIMISAYSMFALAGVLLEELNIDSQPLLMAPREK